MATRRLHLPVCGVVLMTASALLAVEPYPMSRAPRGPESEACLQAMEGADRKARPGQSGQSAWSPPEELSAGSCGDQGLACGSQEKCCEHLVARFGDLGALGPSFVEGRCIPRDQPCGDFWCGNRRCQPFLMTDPTVCCVLTGADRAPEYRCAFSEFSCPGNPARLTIRARRTARLPQRD